MNSFICDCDVDDDEYDDEKEQCEISLTRYKKEKEVIEMAISAIKEIEQYRAIGTVEDFVNLKRGAAIMSDLYKFGYTLYETIETMRDVIDTGNHDRMFLDTYYWLKMLSEYKEIGAVEECREAVEKQKAKKPDIYTDTRNMVDLHGNVYAEQANVYLCPTCERFIGYVGNDIFHYFPVCGQAIDENLEGMENE